MGGGLPETPPDEDRRVSLAWTFVFPSDPLVGGMSLRQNCFQLLKAVALPHF